MNILSRTPILPSAIDAKNRSQPNTSYMNAQTSGDRKDFIELMPPPWFPKPPKENIPILNRYKSVSQNVNTEYEY